MTNRHFRSPDKRLGTLISQAELSKAVEQCCKAGRDETGGILVGRYTAAHDCAVVTSVSDAPRDSLGGGTWFRRGVAGLQRWLNGLWKSRTYYLGNRILSRCDGWRRRKRGVISAEIEVDRNGFEDRHHCPEPILIIVGGDPKQDWHINVYVYVAGEGLRELPEVKNEGSAPDNA